MLFVLFDKKYEMKRLFIDNKHSRWYDASVLIISVIILIT